MLKKILKIKFVFVTITLILLISGINFCIFYLFVPGLLAESKTLIIKPKLWIDQITTILNNNKIIKYPYLFAFFTKIYSLKHSIKSGEYTFTQNISQMQTLKILSSGKSFIHKMIIPEGMLVHEIIIKIHNEERLIGEILGTIPEEFFNAIYLFFFHMVIKKSRSLIKCEN